MRMRRREISLSSSSGALSVRISFSHVDSPPHGCRGGSCELPLGLLFFVTEITYSAGWSLTYDAPPYQNRAHAEGAEQWRASVCQMTD